MMFHDLIRSVLVLCVVVSALITGAAAAQSPLVIQSVTVVDVRDGSLRADRTVVIEGDRIIAIAADAEIDVPETATVIDGSSKFLIPGLWDMHVHSVTNRGWHFPLLLAHGVTGVRNLHTSEPDPLEQVAAIKRALGSGELLGPRFVANGPLVDGPPGIWPGVVLVKGREEAIAAVERLEAGGADFIKIYDNLSHESFEALMARAKALDIPVDGHLPFEVTPQEAAEAGMRTLEHGSGILMGCAADADAARTALADLKENPLPFPEGRVAFVSVLQQLQDSQDEQRCAAVADAYRRHGLAATPTLVTGRSDAMAREMMRNEDAVALLPAETADQWRGMAESGLSGRFAELAAPLLQGASDRTRLLHTSGVTLLAGTDIGNPFLVPGYSLHQELGLLVDAGLAPHEALQTATLNPASVLGMSDTLGQVRTGFAADLVLLRANPLENIENAREIEAVITRGRYLDRAALDEMLKAAK